MVEREFSWDVIAARSLEIYRTVIAARARGATLSSEAKARGASAARRVATPAASTLVNP